MAGGCYALQSPDGGWVVKVGDGYAATGGDPAAAEPFHFQAADRAYQTAFDELARDAHLAA